ncbi:MAG: GtrA family protein [Coprobacillus sp.]
MTKKTVFKQFFKFGIVGVMNVAIYTILYWILIYYKVNYLFATTISYFISSISGYFLNHYWVFKSQNDKKESVVKYYVVYGTSYILNMVCMYLWVDVFGLSQSIAPILTLCVTTPYNFIFNRLWVFKEKERSR